MEDMGTQTIIVFITQNFRLPSQSDLFEFQSCYYIYVCACTYYDEKISTYFHFLCQKIK